MAKLKSTIADVIPLTNLSPITEERYLKMFQPIANPYQNDQEDDQGFERAVFDPYELKQLQHVKNVFRDSPRRVWTLMDIQSNDVLISGYHYAKRIGFCRLGYVISRTAINEGMEMYVHLDRKFM